MTERSLEKKTIILPVLKRDENTLMPLIYKFISKKCDILCLDQWTSYISLKGKGNRHHTVNHKKNFVEPKK